MKPEHKTIKFLNLSIGFLGIQSVFALQAGHASRIFQTLGAQLEQLPLFWLAAPLTGLIIQPILGFYSDRTWTPLGRRIPYLILGSLLTIVALLLLPNAPSFMGYISPLLFAVLLVILLDIAFNMSMHPMRALVRDQLTTAQQGQGYAVQTFLIGIGAIIGSVLPFLLSHYLDVPKTAADGIIPANVRWSFYIGALLLFLCILWTVYAVREKKYDVLRDEDTEHPLTARRSDGIPKSSTGLASVLFKLGLVQFFSWFAFFSMWVFTTPAIAQHIFKLPIQDTSSASYADAANLTGLLFATYNLTATVLALLLPKLYRHLGPRNTHAIALLIGAIGFVTIYFMPTIPLLYVSMILIGIAWGSVLSTPFALLAPRIPAQKAGLYMGLFNCFITLPQIVNGLIGGWLMKHVFDSQAIYALSISGIFMLCATLSTLWLNNDKAIHETNL